MGQGTVQLVASVTPLLDAVVQPDVVIKIQFKEHINQDTINSESIVLTGSDDTAVAVEYTYNGMSKTLIVSPSNDLSGDTYTLTVVEGDNGIRSVLGNKAQAYTHRFTVESKETAADESVGVMTMEATGDFTPLDTTPDGLFLMDSYPSSGDIRATGEPVVLVFSRDINASELVGHVSVRPRYSHPLLADIHGVGEIITLTPDSERNGKTHVLTLDAELPEGTEAMLVLSPELMEGETINILFQQNWNRLYASVADVRLILGMFAKGFSDMELNRMIYRESKSTYELMSTRSVFIPGEWENGQAPYVAGQYVIYSTAYKAILGQALESGSGMRQGFNLGDFGLTESESTSREIKDLLGLLKEEVDRWWKLLNGYDDFDELDVFIRRGGSAVRGGDFSSYPDFMTRVPFQDLGG